MWMCLPSGRWMLLCSDPTVPVEASSAAAWKAESGPSSRQSTDVSSFPWFLLALSALGNMAHFSSTTLYLAVYSSVSGCCLWNTVLDSSGDDFVCGRNGWLDSGYIFCISIWLLDEFRTFSASKWTQVEVFILRFLAERRSVLSRCFSFWSSSRCSHFENWTLLLRASRGRDE